MYHRRKLYLVNTHSQSLSEGCATKSIFYQGTVGLKYKFVFLIKAKESSQPYSLLIPRAREREREKRDGFMPFWNVLAQSETETFVL